MGFKDEVIRVGNLNSLRTIADVRDAVRAYFMLLTINPIGGEYYNIGGNHSCSIENILNFLVGQSTISKRLIIRTDPERLRPIDADLQVPDTSKFSSHTGWKPEISFEKTMLDLLNYWRERVQEEGNSFLTR